MFLRIVQGTISAENAFGFRRFYQDEVIPALEETPGCEGATLVQNDHSKEEFMSLSLWKDQKYATDYESSERYKGLIEKIKPVLADSSEWRVQLSEDFTVEYKPVEQEPVVKSYNIVELDKETVELPESSPKLYMRIVSVKIAQDKEDEFQELYRSEILPTLKTVKGCRYAFLSQGIPTDNEWLSVTVWDSQQDGDDYENSGVFDTLTEKVAHTFSSIYQWKMKLEESGRQSATTEDLKVDEYAVVAGRTFKS